jgi:uncharacterized membrane protein
MLVCLLFVGYWLFVFVVGCWLFYCFLVVGCWLQKPSNKQLTTNKQIQKYNQQKCKQPTTNQQTTTTKQLSIKNLNQPSTTKTHNSQHTIHKQQTTTHN